MLQTLLYSDKRHIFQNIFPEFPVAKVGTPVGSRRIRAKEEISCFCPVAASTRAPSSSLALSQLWQMKITKLSQFGTSLSVGLVSQNTNCFRYLNHWKMASHLEAHYNK